MPASRWKNRMASLGISLAVNVAILGILAGVLASPPKPAETIIAVELAKSTDVNHIQPPKQKTIVMPAASPRPAPAPSRETPKRSFLSTLFGPPPRKEEEAPRIADVRPHPGPAADHPGDVPRTENPLTGSGIGSGHGDRTASTGGGTPGYGPGAPSAPGNGGGGATLVGGDGGNKSIVSVPPPVRHQPEPKKSEPSPAKAEPPATKGESRGAQAVKQPRPTYPSDARDDGIEGTVVLIAGVDTDGRVSEARIEKGSGDRRLDKAAEKAVKQWTYSPAMKDGIAVKTSVRVKVEFRLQ